MVMKPCQALGNRALQLLGNDWNEHLAPKSTKNTTNGAIFFLLYTVLDDIKSYFQ